MLDLYDVNPEDILGNVSESAPSNLISNIYAIDSINDALLLLKSEPVFSNLFSEDEQRWLEKFKNLSNQSKSLVIRLYGRSQKIFRKSEFIKIIPNYTDQCLSELSCLGFISTDMQSFIN